MKQGEKAIRQLLSERFLVRLLVISLILLLPALMTACADDDDDNDDNDDNNDATPGDDDTADDDTGDDDTIDDDTGDDDTVDDDTGDDDTVDDDTVDDDTVDDDTVDDDTVDDDTGDDDTVVEEEEFIAVGPVALADSVDTLLALHEGQGMTVWYEDTETIDLMFSGVDLPAKIRAYLQSVLDPARRQFVMLVGSHGTLPMRLVDPDPEHPGEYDCYTDVYYADLAGDFDLDGDGIYGEYGQDDYDWQPEMHVARLPFDNPDTLEFVADKIATFALDDPAYKWDGLLGAGIIAIPNDSAIIIEMIHNFIIEPAGMDAYRMYQPPSLILPDAWLIDDSLVKYWGANPSGFVMWASHGSSECAFAGNAFICFDDAPSLSDEQPSVIYSSSCSNGNITNPNNLGMALLHHGGVTFVGSTAVTHPGDIGEASLVFLLMVDHTVVQNTPLATAMGDSKARYMDIYFPLAWYDAGLYLRNFFGFNMLGDPALRYWNERPEIDIY